MAQLVSTPSLSSLSEVDIPKALIALTEFVSEAEPSKLYNSLAEKLSAREVQVVEAFVRAAKECLHVLNDSVLELITECHPDSDSEGEDGVSSSSLSRGVTATLENDSKKRQFSLFFRKFDVDGDGMLSKSEFIEAFASLGGSSEGDKLWEVAEANWKKADTDGDMKVDLDEFMNWVTGTNRKLEQVEESREKGLKRLLDARTSQLQAMRRKWSKREEEMEDSMDAALDFWQRAIKTSSSKALPDYLDLSDLQWLGSGNFGQVFKSKKRSDNELVVVKLMGISKSHVAIREWKHGSVVGVHPNIIDHTDIIVSSGDEGLALQALLKEGYATGALKSKIKRTKFPDHFLCMILEFMNRGTVQDWMDKGRLLPGGTMCVLQQVAHALTFMHKKRMTHNDIKPENVLLKQLDDADPRCPVVVKLADLGLAQTSNERTKDFHQYGMTLFCMATGERFGKRKFKVENTPAIVSELKATLTERDLNFLGPDLRKAVLDLPALLGSVFKEEVSMVEIGERPSLQRWGFFDGEGGKGQEATATTAAAQ